MKERENIIHFNNGIHGNIYFKWILKNRITYWESLTSLIVIHNTLFYSNSHLKVLVILRFDHCTFWICHIQDWRHRKPKFEIRYFSQLWIKYPNEDKYWVYVLFLNALIVYFGLECSKTFHQLDRNLISFEIKLLWKL